MSLPDITVSLLSRNSARYLPQTLESTLGQTFRNFELIVADDGSSDNSVDIAGFYAARDARVRVMRHPGGSPGGRAATLNLAAAHARGRYLAWLEAGDLWYPDTLERRFEFLEQRSRLGLMCSFLDVLDEEGRVLKSRTGPDISADCGLRPALLCRLLRDCNLETPTVMLRRTCLETLGHFDDLVYCEWEMWARIAARYPAGFYDDTLVMSRQRSLPAGASLPPDDSADRLAVLQTLLRKTPWVGGWLKHPSVQSALLLRMSRLQLQLNRRVEAARSLAQALRMDPALETAGEKASRPQRLPRLPSVA